MNQARIMIAAASLAACTALACSEPPSDCPPSSTITSANTSGTTPTTPPCCSASSLATCPDPSQLAQRVSTALKTAPALRFVQTVQHGNATIEVRSWMRPSAFRTEVFQKDKPIYAISVVDDQVSEFLARGGPGADGIAARDAEFRYPASLPGRVENANACSRDFGCMFGSNLCSWVGEGSDTAQRLETGISHCNKTELVTLEGLPCYLTQYQVTIPADESGKTHTIGHSYYIDPATSMLRRWVTFQQEQGGPKIERIRDYRDISTDRIPDTFAWAVTKDQFAAPAAAPTVASASAGR